MIARNITKMKKLALLFFVFFAQSFSAEPLKLQVEEVELDKRIVQFIRSFIEFEDGCEFYGKGYPPNNVLPFSKSRSLKEYDDSINLNLTTDFIKPLLHQKMIGKQEKGYQK